MEKENDWKTKLANLAATDKCEIKSEPTKTTEKASNVTIQSLQIAYENRQGKKCTLIYGFEGNDEEIEDFTKLLKAKLGVGGSTRGGEILVQGDKREILPTILKGMGHKVKRRN